MSIDSNYRLLALPRSKSIQLKSPVRPISIIPHTPDLPGVHTKPNYKTLNKPTARISRSKYQDSIRMALKNTTISADLIYPKRPNSSL